MVEKDLLVVDKETKDAIIDKLWNRISSQNLTSQQSSKAYMLGGQPGAGKLENNKIIMSPNLLIMYFQKHSKQLIKKYQTKDRYQMRNQ